MTELQPRPREALANQEQETRSNVNTAVAHIALGSVERSLLEPKVHQVSEEQKHALSTANPDALQPIIHAGNQLSFENRQNSVQLENRDWNRAVWNVVQNITGDHVEPIRRQERIDALAALDIKHDNPEQTTDGLYSSIENFRAKYVGYTGSDIGQFIHDLSADLKNDQQVVDMQALKKRLDAIEPMLGVFGNDVDVKNLIKDFATTQALLTQHGERKQQLVQQTANQAQSAMPEGERSRIEKLWNKMQRPTQPASEPTPQAISTTDQTQSELLPSVENAQAAPELREDIPDEPLTPELAQINPEKFKTLLIQKLKNNHPLAYTTWQYVQQHGRALPGDITINPQDQGSRNTMEGVVHIGTSPTHEQFHDQAVFGHDRFDYEKHIIYRFNHEINHNFYWLMLTEYPALDQLREKIFTRRSAEDNRGFSGLASLQFYKDRGPDVQTKEDMTELFNMYLLDPNYFRSYMQFLANPQEEPERRRVGLASLTPTEANEIEQTIKTAVETAVNAMKQDNTSVQR